MCRYGGQRGLKWTPGGGGGGGGEVKGRDGSKG